MARSLSIAIGLIGALMPIAAHAQVPPETLALPFKGEDLGPGERWVTDVHSANNNAQSLGKDISAVRYHSLVEWRRFRNQIVGRTVNDNHYAYGMPVYAMAPGRVVGCWRNAPDNPKPPALHDEYLKGHIHGNGNFVIIEHANGNRALYAHFKPGTVPTALCPHNGTYVPELRNKDGSVKRDGNGKPEPDGSVTEVTNGAQVATGRLLGRVGNVGSSSDPHLHVHIQNGNNPVEMRFVRGLTTPAAYYGGNAMKEAAPINGPWSRIAGNALPLRRVLLWPPRTAGNAVWNGIPAGAFQRTFDHFVDSGMMPDTITCRNNGQTYDSTWVLTSTPFRAHAGLNVIDYAKQHAKYRSEGFRQTSHSSCGGRIAAIWRK